MRKEFALLIAAALCLTTPAPPVKGQTPTPNKFRRVANPVPNQYVVVLKGTNLSPVTASPSPSPTSSPGGETSDGAEPAASPTPSPSPTSSPSSMPSATLAVASSPEPDPLPSPEPEPPPDPEVVAAAEQLTSTYGGSFSQTFGVALKAFVLSADESTAAAMSQDERVAFIEEDGVVAEVAPEGTPDSVPIVMTPDPNTVYGTQYNAPWGLDRIDQRPQPLNGLFTYRDTGRGVNVYVIDTGIRPTHWEFSGRAVIGYDALGGNGLDCNGHGTHVAGTVAGRTFGVAKGVRIYSVRVLDCEGRGTWSGVIAGVNWVTWHRQRPGLRDLPAVANVSLGGGADDSVDIAVRNSIRANVTYTVAAGNSGADARSFSPARVAEAITVGATDPSDARPWFSNYGSALDLFAPGVYITSAWIGHDLMIRAISGTSMAAPHAAGVAALYLETHPSASPATVRSALVSNSTGGAIGNPGPASPNRLLFTDY